MLITENVYLDGVRRVHNFSDAHKLVRREDGAIFADAYDEVGTHHVYTETDEQVSSEEATEVDKDAALRRFGVEV